MKLNFIKIPLYKLNYVDSIEEIELDNDFLQGFKDDYDHEERQSIFEQLDWAVENPLFDFSSLVESKRFNNKEIYEYLKRLYTFIQSNELF
jgi:hypothetical protein